MPCEPEVDYGHCPEKWVHTKELSRPSFLPRVLTFRRSSRTNLRRHLEEAEDAVAEAADEELMEREARERDRRHREAVARGEELPY